MSRHKSDWSDLYPELLLSISDRLETRSDFSHFRSVCRKWHSSIPKLPSDHKILPFLSPNFPYKLRRIPRPLVRGDGNSNYALFVVANSTFILHRHNPNPNSKPPKPWLITVEEVNPGKLFLRRPLKCCVIRDYPDYFPKDFDLINCNVREIRRDYNLRYSCEFKKSGDVGWRYIYDKIVLLFNPVNMNDNDDCYALILHDKGSLFYVRLNGGNFNNNWGYLRHSRVSCFDDVVIYKGDAWAIDRKGRVYAIGFSNDLKLSQFAADCVCTGYVGDTQKRLVESSEGLYLIDRYHYDEYVKFRVYRLNEEELKWVEVKSLDDRNMFVSTDCCFFVSAEEFPGCGKNCIFFPKDHFPTYSGSTHPDYFYFKGASKELEIGVFHLDDGGSGLVSTYRGYSDIFWPPPKWLFPGWDEEEVEDAPYTFNSEEVEAFSLPAEDCNFSAMNVEEQEFQTVNVPWSEIPSNILREIAKHLHSRFDVCQFRAVCKNWRASYPSPLIPNLLCSLVPHKISTDSAPFCDTGYFRNVSNSLRLVTSTVYLLRPSVQSVTPIKSWLVTVEEVNPGKLFLRLPLRNEAIEKLPENFPKAFSLSELHVTEIGTEYTFRNTSSKWHMFHSGNLSFRGCQRVLLFPCNVMDSAAIENNTALVLYDGGNLVWFNIRYEYSLSIRSGAVTKFDDIANFKGRAYAIDRKGRLYVIGCNACKASRLMNEVMGTGSGMDRQKRLVESDGQLFLVVRHSPEDQIFFRVYKLDEEQHRWDEVTSLGDNILFLTPTFSFLLSPRDCPRWKRNCIVFPTDCLPTYSGCFYPDYRFFRRIVKELQIGVFYVGDNNGARLLNSYPGYSDFFWPPPAWLESFAVQPMVVNSSTIVHEANLEVINVMESDIKPAITSLLQDSEGSLATENFQGVEVRSEFLPTLQKIWAKYGDIMEVSSSCSSSVLESLALLVLVLTRTPGKSLGMSETDHMKATLAVLQSAHLKVDWLAPYVDKAEACSKINALVMCMRKTEKMKVSVQEMRMVGGKLPELVKLEREVDELKSLSIEILNALGPIDLERCLGEDLY